MESVSVALVVESVSVALVVESVGNARFDCATSSLSCSVITVSSDDCSLSLGFSTSTVFFSFPSYSDSEYV